ncbi:MULTISPECIES: MarR family winged helix-turn-helix transcriptional regulator [Neokomagataea]|uniref:MarR family transcriptional regulator n=2 Tax=Neokomagataea TaxID=1223423 RepID=A0ABQ0QKP3_9PROT|nr:MULTISPECIES: MarR family transcriptional regulator [Neokomagataea]MBR0560653.1 MarR family transcriptional regulator [Neokomagataea anthophila]GBR48164.1 MarR family transcriptional regulator [Neokomagataea tanensis NBRC 106556]
MNMRGSEPPSIAAHLYLREEQLRQSFEAQMMAWRRLNAECGALLRGKGLGHSHHRILFLVGSHPGITPGELLVALNITKQSLGRALGDLKDQALLVQERDARDARRRPLRLTPEGDSLEKALFQLMREVMIKAYREAGFTSVEGFRRVLMALQQVETSQHDG